MTTESVLESIQSTGPLLLDGGLAAELEARGHDLNHRLWSARLLMEDPDAIVGAHTAFLEAGADCLISSSYQATPQGFRRTGLNREEAIRFTRLSYQLAQQSCEAFANRAKPHSRRPFVAASIGPYGAYLADGSEYRGYPVINEAQLIDFHRERFEILSEQAELLALETIPCLEEAIALRELLKETPDVPAWVSFTCRDNQHLASGQPLRHAASVFADATNVLAIGVNCTAPHHILSLIGEIKAGGWMRKIVVYPNSGEVFDAHDKSWSPGQGHDGFGQLVPEWLSAGASMIGGCCRVAAADLVEIRKQLKPQA